MPSRLPRRSVWCAALKSVVRAWPPPCSRKPGLRRISQLKETRALFRQEQYLPDSVIDRSARGSEPPSGIFDAGPRPSRRTSKHVSETISSRRCAAEVSVNRRARGRESRRGRRPSQELRKNRFQGFRVSRFQGFEKPNPLLRSVTHTCDLNTGVLVIWRTAVCPHTPVSDRAAFYECLQRCRTPLSAWPLFSSPAAWRLWECARF